MSDRHFDLRRRVTAAVLGLGLCGFPAGATILISEQRIVAPDNDPSDWFGRAVDVYGDVAVVGAPGDDEEAIGAGAAYVFERQGSTWTEVQKLTAGTDAEQFDGFGSDVAVERDLIAVGTPGDNEAGNDAGAVYIFEWNGSSWERLTKLLPDDPSNAGHAFGTAVDIGIAVPAAGTVELTDVVVGAPGADTYQGVVFLFERSGLLWNRLGRFSDSDDSGLYDAGEFGSSVAIRGDHFIAGAPRDDQSGTDTGAAYLFGRTNVINIWNQVLALYPSNPTPGDRFGEAVALDQDVVVVSAPAFTGNGVSGRVFIYGGTNQELTAGADDDAYGSSVAIDVASDLLVVGAFHDDDGGVNAGAVYFLSQDAAGLWQPVDRLAASDAGNYKQFGEAVAVRDGAVIVGGSEEPAFTPGAAYLFDAALFADGFEGGGTAAWSTHVP